MKDYSLPLDEQPSSVEFWRDLAPECDLVTTLQGHCSPIVPDGEIIILFILIALPLFYIFFNYICPSCKDNN